MLLVKIMLFILIPHLDLDQLPPLCDFDPHVCLGVIQLELVFSRESRLLLFVDVLCVELHLLLLVCYPGSAAKDISLFGVEGQRKEPKQCAFGRSRAIAVVQVRRVIVLLPSHTYRSTQSIIVLLYFVGYVVT